MLTKELKLHILYNIVGIQNENKIKAMSEKSILPDDFREGLSPAESKPNQMEIEVHS